MKILESQNTNLPNKIASSDEEGDGNRDIEDLGTDELQLTNFSRESETLTGLDLRSKLILQRLKNCLSFDRYQIIHSEMNHHIKVGQEDYSHALDKVKKAKFFSNVGINQ